MQKVIDKLSQGVDWLLCGVVVVLPIIFDSRAMDAFSLPKWVWLVVLTSALSLSSLSLIFRDNRIAWKKGMAPLIFYGFLLVLVVSTWFSSTRVMAFYGLYAFRMDGLIAWICYGLLFTIGLLFLDDDRMLKIGWAILTALAIASLYALIQYLGWDPIRWTSDPSQSRAWSTFGNSNFLAAYIAMAFPFLLGFFFSLSEKSFYRRTIVGITLLLALWVLAICLSRAAWLGLAIGIIVFVALGSFSLRRMNRKWVLSAAVVLIILAIFIPWKKISLRVEAGARIDSTEWTLRQAGWKAASKMVLTRPLFGFGADGYHVHFRPYMDTFFFRLTRQSQMSPVYPHNETLQIAVNTGVSGLLLYAAFLFCLLAAGLQQRGNRLWAGVLASLVAVWVNNQLSFHNIATASLFFLLAGGLLRASLPTMPLSLPPYLQRKWLQRIILISILGAVVYGSWRAVRVYIADLNFKQATHLEEKNQMEPSLRKYNRAVNLNFQEPTYLHRFAQMGLKLANQSPNPQIRKTWLEATGRVYQSMVMLNPLEGLALNGLGTIHARLFQEFRMPVEKKAEEEFKKAALLDPQLAEAWTNLGALYFSQDKKPEALDAYLKAKDINPYAPQIYNDLGIFYALQGEFEQAKRYWQEALELNPNYTEVQQALQMLDSGKLQQMYGGK